MTKLISQINEGTSLPLKILIPLVIATASGAWVIAMRLHRIESKLDAAWTREQMIQWADSLRERNPSIQVPSAIYFSNPTPKRETAKATP